MKYKLLLLIVFITSFIGINAQLNEVDVALKMETENYHRVLKKDGFVYFLRRVKSKEITIKSYLITKYDSKDLTQIWEKKIELTKYQNVLNFTCFNDHLQLFTVKHNLDNRTSIVHVYQVFLDNGHRTLGKILAEENIGQWKDIYGKAQVAQTFRSAVDSKQNENEVTPLEFRFGLEFSPDSSKVAIYRYDNSQERLYLKAEIYDQSFNTLHTINSGVDEAHLSYGLKIDNNGEVYLLKVANAGDLIVMKINPENKVSAYLIVPEGSTQKVNPQLYIQGDHQVYVAYCNLKKQALVGVSIAKLDFDNETVEDDHYFGLDKHTLDKVKGNKIKNGNYYFELSEIEEVDDKLIIIIEQHKIYGQEVDYEPMASEDLSHWHYTSTTAVTGNMVVLVYDKELNPLSKFEILKYQKATVLDGLNTLSHSVHRIGSKLMFVYSNTSKEITNEELYMQTLDLNSAAFSTPYRINLPKAHTGVIVSSLAIDNNRLLMQTRKGILGKKNYLGIYGY